MDIGKHEYELKKKAAKAKKNQQQVQVKEIKLRPGTGEGDYQVKLRNLIRFLENGDKAKVTVRFKGREMMHHELGLAMMERLVTDLTEHGIPENKAKFEGRQLVVVFSPKKKK
jgi:translation initiation factor IF-3